MNKKEEEEKKEESAGAAAQRTGVLVKEESSPKKGEGEGEKRLRGLSRKERVLVSLLGLCRYLTVAQVIGLGAGAKTAKATAYRLRGLAGEATRRKVRPFEPALLRVWPFRSFKGEPFQLWGLTSNGYAVASAELGRPLKVPRVDIGAAFAEHFVLLTDLFVRLAQPYLQRSVAVRALPFRWDAAEEVSQPWREQNAEGERARVIRPDAVLELPSARRRFFIECETGSHTLEPVSREKHQATLRKLERYDAYVSGFADVGARLSHYQRRYPDGWPCEVLFVVPHERRQRNTAAALARFLASRAGTRLQAHALTLSGAAEYCATALGSHLLQPVAVSPPRETTPGFYGEREHAVVKDFVLGMTAALAEANASLQRFRLGPVPLPASRAGMLDFLNRAHEEVSRHRLGDGHPSHG